MHANLLKIEPDRKYSLREIVELKLIPGVNIYSEIYKRVTIPKEYDENLVGVTRSNQLATETTRMNIRAESNGKPWSKINGKIFVKGEEIVKFLKLNDLTDTTYV